jgi:hypothetical protein
MSPSFTAFISKFNIKLSKAQGLFQNPLGLLGKTSSTFFKKLLRFFRFLKEDAIKSYGRKQLKMLTN